jgi:hypothetical protein
MKPNYNDPHHVTLKLLQDITSICMQREEQVLKERSEARALHMRCAELQDGINARDKMIDLLKRICAPAKGGRGKVAEMLEEHAEQLRELEMQISPLAVGVLGTGVANGTRT